MITKKLWVSVLGLATAIALAFALQTYIGSLVLNTSFDAKDHLLRQISTWCLWAALFPIILTLAQKFRFESGTRLKSTLVHICAGVVIACVHGTIHMFFVEVLLHPERDWEKIQKVFAEVFFYTTLWRFLMYQIILSASLALNYYRSIKETEIQSSRLQDSILRSQIESLKMQVDPDLLFKSLNELPNLMQRDLDSADEMVARLGDYLRITLENSQNQEVTLRQEIELLKCYLAIENIRKPNSVEVQFEIEEETLECNVPSLILQAPVEDAIRQRNDDAPLHLVIVSSKTEAALLLTIADEDKSQSSAKSPRLSQLLERFNALYQTKIHVHTYGSDEKTSTRIELPVVLEKNDADLNQPNLSEVEPRKLVVNENSNSVRKWLLITAIFTFLATYWGIQSYVRDVSAGHKFDLAEQFLGATGWYIWALVTPFVLRLSQKFPIQQPHRTKNIMIHVAGYICTMFVAASAYAVVRSVAVIGEYNFWEVLPVNFARTPFAFDILCYGTIVFVETALRYGRKIEADKGRTAKLNEQLSRARLQALRMQLHPHFLFNALNSLSELMQENQIAAKEMIENLKNFLRLTIDSSQVHEILFEKELEFLNCYLSIERVRFQNRLSVNMDIESGTMKVPVPNLVLQPIVENAIRHGIAPRKKPGHIQIKARRNNGMLQVSIQDNGPGMQRNNGERPGLGLANTRERLRQLYGKGYRFEMMNAPEGGLKVTLEIPAFHQSATN